MARGKFISETERDVIRVGISRGLSQAAIARFIGRSEGVITQQIQKMRQNGTLGAIPFDFLADSIAQAIRDNEARQ